MRDTRCCVDIGRVDPHAEDPRHTGIKRGPGDERTDSDAADVSGIQIALLLLGLAVELVFMWLLWGALNG